MTSSKSGGSPPPAPVRTLPPESWSHYVLYCRVREALLSLPLYFRSQTVIEGIAATDIFTLNSALGATIETQVVATLNRIRKVWDPDDKYPLYGFVRQSQAFPDLVLRRSPDAKLQPNEEAPLFGIELKGWYLLAKEGEPSGRYKVTPSACAVADLLVVVPWVLSNILSGTPLVYAPYIESARFAAERRNFHWQHTRITQSDATIAQPPNATPYPRKADTVSDKPASDAGTNFGRFARAGFMDEFFDKARQELIAGIRAEHWLSFFKLFQDQTDRSVIGIEIEKLRRKLDDNEIATDERMKSALAILANLERLLA